MTQPTLYSPMARLLLILVAVSATFLFLSELYYDPFKGFVGKPELLGAVAGVTSLIAMLSFFIKDEKTLKRWMLGLLIVPFTLAAVPLMNPAAPLVYAPTVALVTLVALRGTWRLWLVYAVLAFVAIVHVTQNPSINPYAMRFWIAAVHIALPLHTLLLASDNYEEQRRRAAVQFLVIGVVLASLLAINIHLVQKIDVSPWPNLYGLFAMALPLYLVKVKRISLDGMWGRFATVLFLSVFVLATLKNGSLATAIMPAYVFFTFLLLKPREAFAASMGLLILAITTQQAATVGFFSIDGVFLRFVVANALFMAMLYQLRQLQLGEGSEFNDRDALKPMAYFLGYGILAAAIIYWVHGERLEHVLAEGSHLLVTNAFAWLLITWMATTLTLEAQRMRKVVKAMQDAQAGYLAESRKVATLMKRQAVDSLLGGLAHNLNNLLQPVLMLSEHLMSKPNLPPEKRTQLYKAIHDSGVEQKALLSKVFAHAREMEDEQLASGADLEDIVRFAQAGLKRTQQIEWTSDMSEAQREGILALSKSALHTVLLNVINNGLQAAKERDVASITLSLADENDALVLHVSDNGTGMSKEIQQRAMDKFFTTKPVEEGTGLGLSEVRELLDDINGELMIEASSDKGTTIKITIPFKQA